MPMMTAANTNDTTTTPNILTTFPLSTSIISINLYNALKHTTTLFSSSDHYILSREWRVIVDQVRTNYHGRPMVLKISQVWPRCWLWGILILFGCIISQLKPSKLYILSCGNLECRAPRGLSYTKYVFNLKSSYIFSLALSASFEYLCYGSTAIIIFLILSVRGTDVIRRQILTSKGGRRAERVKKNNKTHQVS